MRTSTSSTPRARTWPTFSFEQCSTWCSFAVPVAHACIKSVEIPAIYRGNVFRANDIAHARPIATDGAAPGFKHSEYPAPAREKVRFVGEMIAMCVAPTRAQAGDIAQPCVLNLEEWPAVWDIKRGAGLRCPARA
jgi:CO/xanthine dehydrogenase Mo-binding subunit